jgi:hypothetical protein
MKKAICWEWVIVPQQRKTPRKAKERPSSAGGSATHAGVGFQDRVAAWIAVRIRDVSDT